MYKKKVKIFFLVIVCLILKLINYSYAAAQHGPVINLSCFPYGYGTLNLPYSDAVTGTAYTSPEEDSSSRSAKRYSLLAGYFYDFIQMDFSYDLTIIRNQAFDNSSLEGNIPENERRVFLFRGGKRFSSPGDSSYHLVFFGLKRVHAASDYEDMELTATGYLAGYEGFYSFGRKYPVEFVTKFNSFIGRYRKEKFSSNIQFTNIEKKNSLTAGAGLGIGILYEPYDIAFLFNISYDFDQVAYRGDHSGNNVSFAYSINARYFGCEIAIRIPNFKYNKRQ
jgi:hypothetical protein